MSVLVEELSVIARRITLDISQPRGVDAYRPAALAQD
jgi:hypothetical protein